MSRHARRLFLVVMVALAAGGGSCSGQYLITNQENYYTYERPFTDAAAAQVRKDADELCRRRNRVAIQVSDVCEMTRCFTNFQCVSQGELPQVVR
ncbi:MAG: hypothetical protein IT513_04800 [Burkholderiales bacterium]|nr:hypothetical protein [Burkholderiales bacterium]